jgi:hypothetical protein
MLTRMRAGEKAGDAGKSSGSGRRLSRFFSSSQQPLPRPHLNQTRRHDPQAQGQALQVRLVACRDGRAVWVRHEERIEPGYVRQRHDPPRRHKLLASAVGPTDGKVGDGCAVAGSASPNPIPPPFVLSTSHMSPAVLCQEGGSLPGVTRASLPCHERRHLSSMYAYQTQICQAVSSRVPTQLAICDARA